MEPIIFPPTETWTAEQITEYIAQRNRELFVQLNKELYGEEI